jgi:hypothetical protein
MAQWSNLIDSLLILSIDFIYYQGNVDPYNFLAWIKVNRHWYNVLTSKHYWYDFPNIHQFHLRNDCESIPCLPQYLNSCSSWIICQLPVANDTWIQFPHLPWRQLTINTFHLLPQIWSPFMYEQLQELKIHIIFCPVSLTALAEENFWKLPTFKQMKRFTLSIQNEIASPACVHLLIALLKQMQQLECLYIQTTILNDNVDWTTQVYQQIAWFSALNTLEIGSSEVPLLSDTRIQSLPVEHLILYRNWRQDHEMGNCLLSWYISHLKSLDILYSKHLIACLTSDQQYSNMQKLTWCYNFEITIDLSIDLLRLSRLFPHLRSLSLTIHLSNVPTIDSVDQCYSSILSRTSIHFKDVSNALSEQTSISTKHNTTILLSKFIFTY